ncbi:MAG: prephenate dehydrogenase/arogenate dehydrogenase family protein [Thermomicrobiales bacterium]
MQQVTIVGLGLIGGSIGLALRRWSSENSNALRIVGFDEDMAKQSLAKKKGVVDATEWSLGNAVKDSDIVIVATPVGSMQQVFEDIGSHLKHGTVVTDTGSTKADVLAWSKALPAGVSFIGGHPMAGKSESLEAADANLFKGATWVICPSVSADEESIKTVLGIVATTGAESYFADPVDHDSFVAGISHLPFVVAATLARSVVSDPAWRDMKGLASSGFRDTTRLALGNPVMHADIVRSNKESVNRWVTQMIEGLEDFQSRLNNPDEETSHKAVREYLEEAQDARARVEVAVNRASEQSSATQDQLNKETVSDQMGRMFLGGFGKRRRDKTEAPPRR